MIVFNTKQICVLWCEPRDHIQIAFRDFARRIRFKDFYRVICWANWITVAKPLAFNKPLTNVHPEAFNKKKGLNLETYQAIQN